MKQSLVAFIAFTLFAVGACSAEGGVESETVQSQGETMLVKGQMIVYVPGILVPQEELISLGPPEGLGGVILEGSAELSGRIDYQAGALTAGIFQAKSEKLKVRITMPFTEHGTIINGVFRMTDETGQTHVFKPGDSYLLKQGTVVVWDQFSPILQKSFFNVVE
jgi:hypothetical protein